MSRSLVPVAPAAIFRGMAFPRGARTHDSGAVGTAVVTASAARGILVSEISPNKYASALLGLCVMGDKSKPTLALVAKCFELCYQVVRTGCEVFKRRDHDAAFLIAFDEADLLEI